MLVYQYDENGQLYVTQVLHGFSKTDVNSFKKEIEEVYRGHRASIEGLKKDPSLIAVFGNAAANGNGIQKDCYHFLNK